MSASHVSTYSMGLMAASEIDQKILGRIAKFTRAYDPSLSATLFQLLGLSVQLSHKLSQARRLRHDASLSVRSHELSNAILWLSKEGLGILEDRILPRCHEKRDGHCLVLVAKLRASFYHVFCLFNNRPPIGQLDPVTNQASSPRPYPEQNAKDHPDARDHMKSLTEQARQNVPSVASESSYITNPFPADSDDLISPPADPDPSAAVLSQAGMQMKPLLLDGYSRGFLSHAEDPFESINFVPRALKYFQVAAALADRYLPGSDPLRLSIALEQCVFLEACAQNAAAAIERAQAALHDVYAAPEGMDDADFQDAAALVQAIALIERQGRPPGPETTGLDDSCASRQSVQ